MQFYPILRTKPNMKGMKGKFLRKLKTIQALGTLKQGMVFQFTPTVEKFPQTTTNRGEEDLSVELPVDNIGLSKQFKDLDNDVLGPEFSPVHDKETLSPSLKLKDYVFVKDTTMNREIPDEEKHDVGEMNSSLLEFEEKCPPGGSNKVILYTTSLRGIRKTFEDCNAIKFLLESFKVSFSERDVSLHQEFREEMWKIMGGKVVPPRLFIKGRYIGGADEVVGVLNEQGKLRKLLEGIPLAPSNSPCAGCANMRFSVCCNCNGSRKIVADGESDELCYIRCPECNENGLVKCVICC